ncbi:HAD family hydrolase [Nonomuraea roseoviolacea subsp. roseoviolacea]|uniref:Hydrolase of the HAD superfamily n=1 Tax=Nonomuraea roseoviolacea subsp. carminata TaxID=160689 RepID=A0ABT1K511_9ACTN|nr:HAD family hydrolase [Nonomuraea roseoviolacea]MCP2348109.1 putative hydrolase of the HAD superfamily [Nonomuraea roseoviolacea subsp. carminata]
MQRLVLFDLDNTLVDRLDAFRRWVGEFAERRGLDDGAAEWMVRLDGDGSLPMDVFFARVRERFSLAEPVEELWAAYRAGMPRLVVCREPVLRALEGLRDAGWRIGIVTNGMEDNQLGKIRRSGLAERVDGWAISGAEGVRKPDPRLFEIAAERCGAGLGVGGGERWVVGDDPVNDVEGGRTAGLRVVWIDRGVQAWPPGLAAPGHVVADVEGAVGVITGP